MRKALLIISVLTVFVSCRTTKHSTSEIQASVSEQKDISVRTVEQKIDTSFIVVNETENAVITLFSLPDSTGRQYVVNKTEIRRNKTATNKKNVQTEKESMQEDKTNTLTIVKTKDTKNLEIKIKLLWVQLVVGIILFLVLILCKRIK